MRRLPLLLLLAALAAAALPAAAQDTPRRPPADTVRLRPGGDSIRMAEVEEDEEEAAVDEEEAEEDSVPRPKPGPYARSGGTGPFTVQASGQVAARPPRGEVVWLEGRRAAPADSARRDTARAGGQRVASAQPPRRDTAAAARPAPRDTAGARRQGSTTAATTARRDTASRVTRTQPRDTAGARRQGSTTAAAAPARPPAAGGSAARPRTHTVAAGETFYGIARRYRVTSAQLRALNPDIDIQAIEVGDVLRLPASARDTRAPAASQRPGAQTGGRTEPAAQRRTHTVAAGETLYGIARRYGVTVDAIREANELETDQVRTGQRLVIPPAR